MKSSQAKHFNKTLYGAAGVLRELYDKLYLDHPAAAESFPRMLGLIENAFLNRSAALKERDQDKQKNIDEPWFLSNRICGLSLYVDRFCGNLEALRNKLEYFEELGVNLLHLMPVFESPSTESDGGYAVSDFRKVSGRFGNLNDLVSLQQELQRHRMYLMLDIVLNHTSNRHEWALKAKQGEKKYQDYFYFFDDRSLPDQLEKTMPEIFPENSPGNFTYVKELNKWVMTVFHDYQWDLNYRNPDVFNEMLDNIFFYANLGVDILRIDAPAFIWKEKGTAGQNLDEVHTILQLIKQCVQLASPGMALLAEAIVSPVEIMKYFGTGKYTAKESDLAYNATHMALQWDALATGDTRIMMAAQSGLLKKPYGTSWITYTRCHDDIGLGYDDEMIRDSGFDPLKHRDFLKRYYSSDYPGSTSTGLLFAVNEKTGDARISGSLASLCGLEKALEQNDESAVELSIKRIILMQAHSFFLGGIPMIFYGDEQGYTNDYSYLDDNDKRYDNRWVHRPLIKEGKNKLAATPGTIENKIFSLTKKLINLRFSFSVIADKKNLTWLDMGNNHVAGYLRAWDNDRLYCIFNFSNKTILLNWEIFNKNGLAPAKLYDHWEDQLYIAGEGNENFCLLPYQFAILAPR